MLVKWYQNLVKESLPIVKKQKEKEDFNESIETGEETALEDVVSFYESGEE